VQALIDGEALHMGFDWSGYNAALHGLAQLYDGRWWPTGLRSCWDELAVLSRLVAVGSFGSKARTLARLINKLPSGGKDEQDSDYTEDEEAEEDEEEDEDLSIWWVQVRRTASFCITPAWAAPGMGKEHVPPAAGLGPAAHSSVPSFQPDCMHQSAALTRPAAPACVCCRGQWRTTVAQITHIPCPMQSRHLFMATCI
jgi:hypothetical protein